MLWQVCVLTIFVYTFRVCARNYCCHRFCSVAHQQSVSFMLQLNGELQSTMTSVKSVSARKRVLMSDSPSASPSCTMAPVTTVSQVMTSTDHSSKLIVGLDSLRADGVLCDYTIIAGGLEMHVHRNVLVACSDYFRAMLTGDMRESRESSVKLQGITSFGLQAVIEFIYTGSLKISLDNVDEILAAASHLQVSHSFISCQLYFV